MHQIAAQCSVLTIVQKMNARLINCNMCLLFVICVYLISNILIVM